MKFCPFVLGLSNENSAWPICQTYARERIRTGWTFSKRIWHSALRLRISITELEMPDKKAAERVLAMVEQGYKTMIHFFAAVEDGEQRRAIGQKLVLLRARLDTVTRQVHPVP